MSSVEDSDSSFVMSDKDGNFKYDLNGRKIVHNQEIEVSSSDPYSGDDEEDEEVERNFN